MSLFLNKQTNKQTNNYKWGCNVYIYELKFCEGAVTLLLLDGCGGGYLSSHMDHNVRSNRDYFYKKLIIFKRIVRGFAKF